MCPAVRTQQTAKLCYRHGCRRKAKIINQQFCSVFTDEDTTINMPKLEGPPSTHMDKIEITESGIRLKLLSELNADKAPEPYELTNSLLKNVAKEIFSNALPASLCRRSEGDIV